MKSFRYALAGAIAAAVIAASAGLAAAQEMKGKIVYLVPDAARRVPDRLDRRDHQVHEGCRLRGHLARRPESRRPADEPAQRRDQHQAGGAHHRRRRLRRDQARHREGARRRHPGDDLRPADHLDARPTSPRSPAPSRSAISPATRSPGCSPRNTARPRARCCKSSATRPIPTPSISRRVSRRR